MFMVGNPSQNPLSFSSTLKRLGHTTPCFQMILMREIWHGAWQAQKRPNKHKSSGNIAEATKWRGRNTSQPTNQK